MDPFVDEIRQLIASEALIQPGDLVLAAVSGGADSTALLQVLFALRQALRIRLAVVHIDHQLRHDSSEDAAFVRRWAESLQLPVTIVTRDVQAERARCHLSLEDAARRARYDACLQLARRCGANRLAVAHTADDQAETVMMRLIRGAGPTGLAAIPLTRPLAELCLIRPLLQTSRQAVLEYLHRQGLAFRRDPSNDDPRFLRNRIRAELLPLLERTYNPQIRHQLQQLAHQCRTDTAFLQQTARRYWKRLVKADASVLAVQIRGFVRQPKAVQQQLMRLVIQELQGDVTGFEFRHWREIERLFGDRPDGTILDLPGELQCIREGERVLIRHRHVPAGQ